MSRNERREAEQGMEAEKRREEGNRRIATDRGKEKGRTKKRRGRRGRRREEEGQRRERSKEKRKERREEKRGGKQRRHENINVHHTLL